MIEIGHTSHTGLRREYNEDSYWADPGLGLFLVVDGMGGHGRGEVAAAIARDALVNAARAGRQFVPAILDVGASIAGFAPSVAGNAPTGATLALLKIEGDQFETLRIGDARAYLWQHGALASSDVEGPAAVSDQELSTSATAPEPGMPQRNRITHALGVTASSDLAVVPVRGRLERGMQFLLCTDGLNEDMDEPHIAAILARTDLSAQECVDHLLLAALDAGGRDNITIVLVRCS